MKAAEKGREVLAARAKPASTTPLASTLHTRALAQKQRLENLRLKKQNDEVRARRGSPTLTLTLTLSLTLTLTLTLHLALPRTLIQTSTQPEDLART